MKIGSGVTWKSQSRGFKTVKRGTIVAVVPAGQTGAGVFMKRSLAKKYSGSALGTGAFRKAKSYLVMVPAAKKSKAKARVYWPLAGKLASL